MPRSSKVGLAAANRFKDNPLWDREWHEKILDKLHKGVAKSQLRELQFGRGGQYKSRLSAENNKVIEVMRKRGKSSIKKHPPVSVDHRLVGRDPIVPILESVLDVNLFISDTGNIHTDKEATVAAKRFADSLENKEQQQLELLRLHRIIHSQAAGTSTNTTMAKFRAYFERSTVFYLLSSSTDRHGHSIKLEKSSTSAVCHAPEDHLKESLRDICMAIKVRDDIAPSYYNRAVVLRKLHCHEAACGDINHALKLLHHDVGNNELAMMKYRKFAALLERELGFFVESGMEYQKVKELSEVHKHHEKTKRLIEKQKRMAKRMKNANQRFIIMQQKQTRPGHEEKDKNTHQKVQNKFRKMMLPTLKSPNKVEKVKQTDDLNNGPTKKQNAGGFLKIVHSLTGGKHMSAVLNAKRKFLHGLLSPLAKAMAGTNPGERTAHQIERIVNFVYTTRSDDLISLEKKQLQQICQWFGNESVAAGKYVYRQGDPQDAYYVVASGMVQIMLIHPSYGYEVPVKTLYPGDSFGKIHFSTPEEIEQSEKKEQENQDNMVRMVGSDGIEDVYQLPEQSKMATKIWASESLNVTPNARRASIYASRHCELICLKWVQKHEMEKEKSMTEFEINKHQRHKTAILHFQDHTMQRRLTMLKKCTVFKHMSDKDLGRLATIGSIHQWHQGKSLIHQGEVMNHVYVIVRGVCEIRKRRKMSVIEMEAKQKVSPTGEGEDPLATGMMWQQQYNQHMTHRLQNLVGAAREEERAKGNGLRNIPAQWVKVGLIKVGDICGEFCLLNSTQTTVSPIEVVADTTVDALVFNLAELKPFINHGMFSGSTRLELVNSVGMHVPSELKVTLDLSARTRWNKKKANIVKRHIVGHRHLHPVGSVLDSKGNVKKK